ncbi:MAG: pilus assembly protein [Hyphomicrobiales bacterium]|nr:pilus assembly protein [Hyphomicrobiales bacterium]
MGEGFHQIRDRALAVPLRLWRQMPRFRADKTAIAAVEFALIFPFMLLMYFGSVEIELAVSAGHKLEVVADEMALLLGAEVSQNLQDSDMKAIFDAATPMMYPYDITNGKLAITLSSVTFEPTAPGATTYNAMMDWSVTNSGTNANLRLCSFSPLSQTSDGSNPSLTSIHTGVVQGGSIMVADLVYSYPSPLNIQNFFYHSQPTITMRRTVVDGVRDFGYLNYNPGGAYSNQVCTPANAHS